MKNHSTNLTERRWPHVGFDKKLMSMQIYIIHTEIHQWEYTLRLTKCDFQQPDFEPHAVEINSRKSHCDNLM